VSNFIEAATTVNVNAMLIWMLRVLPLLLWMLLLWTLWILWILLLLWMLHCCKYEWECCCECKCEGV